MACQTLLSKGDCHGSFEILLNGKRLYTAGIGEFGVMTAAAMYTRVQTKRGPTTEVIKVMTQGNRISESSFRAQ